MNYLLNGKQVKVDCDDSGTMLILSSDGNRIVEKLIRCQLMGIHETGIHFSGLIFRNDNSYSMKDLFFAYIEENKPKKEK